MSREHSVRPGRERFARHAGFWAAIFLFFAYIDAGYDRDYSRAAINQAVILPIKMGFAYAVVYRLIPQFLNVRRRGLFIAQLLGITLLASATYRLAQGYITLPLYHPELRFTPLDPSRFLWAVFEIFFPAAILVSIRLFRARYESAQLEQELRAEKLAAELRFLKAQISPHFLFNTLNNIYGLSLAGSRHAPEAILKLSGLLRAILKNADNRLIRVEEEVAILEDYIALERLRYGTRLDFSFIREIDSPGRMIAPLIILSLVENSFKHGASESLSNPFIRIRLNVAADMLRFSLENSREPAESAQGDGIGLANIRRQLDLIYPDRYLLDVRKEPDVYRLNLSVNLHA